MPATERTPNIGLSRWTLDDRPQMEDINRDNDAIDAAFGSHERDMTSHLSPAEHSLFSNRFYFAEYFGTNDLSASITLAVKPKFVIVFPLDHAVGEVSGDKFVSFIGFAYSGADSIGVSISGNTVTVKTVTDTYRPVYLNRLGITYCIAAFA